jgi:hypothetical protein
VRSEVSGKDFHRMYSGVYRMMEFWESEWMLGWLMPGCFGILYMVDIYLTYMWHYIVLWSLSVQFVAWNRTFCVQEVSWARRSSRLVGESELAATAVARVCNWNAEATTKITFSLVQWHTCFWL